MNGDDWNSKLRNDMDRIERLARLVVLCAIGGGVLVGWWLS
jgi:hypothetical protein